MTSRLPTNIGAATITLLSLCFTGVHTLHLYNESEDIWILLSWTVGPLLVSLGLVVFAYWLRSNNIEQRYQIRIALWYLGGALTIVIFGILIVINQASMGGALTEPLYLLINSATGGAAIGSLVGLYDIRSRRRDDILVNLHDAAQQLLETTSVDEACQTTVETLTTLLDLDISTIWLETEDRLEPVASTEKARELFDEIPAFEEGEGLAWRVYDQQQAQVFNDLDRYPETYNPETPITSELIIPLGDHGILICGTTGWNGFQRYQQELVHILATHTKLVLDNIRQTQHLQDREKELERQNNRLDQFASVVSHDLQNPLAVITGYLELARESHAEEDFDQIEEAANRMQTLIDDLLALARSGDTVDDVKPVDVTMVAEDAWENVATDDLTLNFDMSEHRILADESRLKQLFENLFRNSIEHGKTVTEIHIESIPTGIAIEDDGEGIPVDDHDDIFEYGYSNTDEGSGLGLAIVQEVAHGHDWEITVTNSSNNGARFEITGMKQP